MTDEREQPSPASDADAGQADQAHLLEYEGAVGIADVGSVHAALQAALTAPGPVVLDTERVTQVDTAVMQLWIAFTRDAHAHGASVRWHRPSDAVRGAAGRLGIAGALGLADDSIASP